jgi:hypothetical protein
MHGEIFSDKQRELLPYMAPFKRSFYLVGGTAIALHLGHRTSIDFDLFTPSRLNKTQVRQRLSQIPYEQHLIFEDTDQLHLIINGVKVTFFIYPYPVEHPVKLENILSMPSLLSLAAMKSFALRRRAKWKDYVDLYFIIRDNYPVKEIVNETEKIFGQFFSQKLFREQLAYHADIDYTEEVNYLNGFVVKEEEIKAFLINKSLEWE